MILIFKPQRERVEGGTEVLAGRRGHDLQTIWWGQGVQDTILPWHWNTGCIRVAVSRLFLGIKLLDFGF